MTLADFVKDAVADAEEVEATVRVFVGIDGFDVPLLDTVVPADADTDADDEGERDARGDVDAAFVSDGSGEDEDATDCDAELVTADDTDAEPDTDGAPVALEETFAEREKAELFVDEAEKHAEALKKALADALRLAAVERDTETDVVGEELAAEDALARVEKDELCVELTLRAGDEDTRGDEDDDTDGEDLGDMEEELDAAGDAELLSDARALPVSFFDAVMKPEVEGDADSDAVARGETDGAADDDDIAVADSLAVVVRDFAADADAPSDTVAPDALEKGEGETEVRADAESTLLALETADTLKAAVPDASPDADGDDSSDSVAAALVDSADEGDGAEEGVVDTVAVGDAELKLDALADVAKESVVETDGDPVADGSEAVGCGEPDGADDALAATVEDTEDTTDDVTVRDVFIVPVGDTETTAVADGDGIETVVPEGTGELDEPTENEGESLTSMDDESSADAVAHAVDFAVTEGDADVVSDGLDDDDSSGDKDSSGLVDRVAIRDAGRVASTETDAGFETKDDALGLPVVDALCDVDRDWEGDACPERDGTTLEVVSGDPVPSFDESALGEADGLL